MKRINIGLKIWSTNKFYLNAVKDLKAEGYFDYIELFVDPKSSQEDVQMWREFEVPYLIHAPHSAEGLNFSDKNNEEKNRSLIGKVKIFDDALNAQKIIFHPGVNGNLDETIRQIRLFKDEFPGIFKKAIIENKPKVGINDEDCLGASSDEMSRIKKESGQGFCFDIGHAICFAAWAKRQWWDVLCEFMALEPEVFHMSDGDIDGVYDRHTHLGKGTYDLKKIISIIPDNSFVSIETSKDSKENLDDFKEDVDYLRMCLSHGN